MYDTLSSTPTTGILRFPGINDSYLYQLDYVSHPIGTECSQWFSQGIRYARASYNRHRNRRRSRRLE